MLKMVGSVQDLGVAEILDRPQIDEIRHQGRIAEGGVLQEFARRDVEDGSPRDFGPAGWRPI